MNTSTTYDKTTSGKLEVSDNAIGLSLMERRILILVNGEKDTASLQKLSLCDDLGPTIDRLLDLRLIEAVGSSEEVVEAEVTSEADTGDSDGSGVVIDARDFMCNTLQTFGNRVRIGDLNKAISEASDIGALKVLVKPWYQAISDTPGGMYQADDLRKEVLRLLDHAEAA